jgi:adenylate cyclase
MEPGFLIALVCAAVWFSLLLVAVRGRWFAHLKRGFRLTLAVSLISVAVWSSMLIAYWGYTSARKTLVNQTDTEMNHLATLVQQEVNDALQEARAEAVPAAAALAHDLERGTVQDTKAALRQFNPRFLEARILSGTLNRDAEIHPRFIKELRKYAVDIKVQVAHAEHPPEIFSVAYDIQRDLGRLVDRVHFGETGYIVVVNDDGHIIAHHDPNRIGDDVSDYEAVQRVRAGDKEDKPLQQRNKSGTLRLFAYRPVFLPNDRSPLTVLAEMDVAEVEKPIQHLLGEFYIGFGVLAALAVLLAAQISGSLHRPIEVLLGVVHRIKNGDLSANVEGTRKDEVGQLGAALNDMVHALEERNRVKEVFGKYVTTQVSEEVLKGKMSLGGEMRRVTMLISDIRGFTTMSEQMTAEEVVSFLNEYFSEMVDAVFEYGGVLDKFLGDGLLAVYGSFGEETDHPRRAVATALRMKARLARINEKRASQGLPAIKIGVGIHTGEVVVGNIGSQRRLEYTVIGDGVNVTSRLEALNKEFATMILISEATYEAVKDDFECRHMPEAKLRGKSKVIQFYELLDAKSNPSTPEGPGAPGHKTLPNLNQVGHKLQEAALSPGMHRQIAE